MLKKQENDLNTFPFRIESLYIYGSILQPMEQVKCRVQIKPQAENQLRANMDVIGQNGLLHMRIVGWDDRVFDLRLLFIELDSGPEKCFLAHHGLNQSLRFQNLRHLSAAACKIIPMSYYMHTGWCGFVS